MAKKNKDSAIYDWIYAIIGLSVIFIFMYITGIFSAMDYIEDKYGKWLIYLIFAIPIGLSALFKKDTKETKETTESPSLNENQCEYCKKEVTKLHNLLELYGDERKRYEKLDGEYSGLIKLCNDCKDEAIACECCIWYSKEKVGEMTIERENYAHWICEECNNEKKINQWMKDMDEVSSRTHLENKQYKIIRKIQVQGESTPLFFGIALLLGISFYILQISPYILLGILIFIFFMVRIQQGNLIGNGVVISPSQFPEIYDICKQACEKLDMSIPKIIYKEDPTLNAFAIGAFGSESMVLNSRLIEDLDDKELEFIIGHELCHIKYKHTLWSILTTSKDSLAIPIFSDIFGIIFNVWGRKCEYTCDRGGLYVNRDIKGAIGALGKLAVGKKGYEQLNVDEFISQNENEFHNLSEKFATHPHLNNRKIAMFQFNQSIEKD